nr:MAG TPA: hypothetical protein [Caudoviricetes sp.]
MRAFFSSFTKYSDQHSHFQQTKLQAKTSTYPIKTRKYKFMCLQD